MQLKSFKIFIVKVIHEGNRLQKHDITGKRLTKRRFTDTQVLSIVVGIISICMLPTGFSDNFAGYVISFLGIFIGLFSTIIISMSDKTTLLFEGFKDKDQLEQARLLMVKNYLVQFTGLTSYSILMALVLIILLCLVLLSDKMQVNIEEYKFIKSLNELNRDAFLRCLKASGLVGHRFFIIYLLSNFFIITTFAVTSYFSYINSEYKNIKLK